MSQINLTRTDGDADGEDCDATSIDEEESTGAVASGNHPVTKFLRQGYLRIGGEQVHRMTNSFSQAQDVITDKDVPWDLQPGDSKLFRIKLDGQRKGP
uniref:Uncharacterized protein n=1 Tax=Tetranychus urticae TaxID=32264 RepID=T1KBL8_TETUR